MEQPSGFQQLIAELRGLRRAAETADWAVPPEPERLDEFQQFRLAWRPRELVMPSQPLSVQELRDVAIPERIERYLESDSESVLLVRVPAGVGKTYAAVQAGQRVARDNGRILYCAARHDFYGDLQMIPNFDPSLWYHWLPIHASKDEDDPLPTTCRYAEAMFAWLHKGYSAFDLCLRLCSLDKWMRACPFRLQRGRKEPIIFAMHNHLVHGVSVADFDAVIVDELPLQAFVETRLIPRSGIEIGARGPLGDLTGELTAIADEAKSTGHTFRGQALFERVGPILSDVYAQVETIPDALPVVPSVYGPHDVQRAPYWYIFEMLRLASPEYDAWRNGWPRWAERVWVDGRGVNLLRRGEPWEKLPRKIVALDATGQAPIYRALFGREIEEYAPRVDRAGRLYQVAGRLNGIHTLVEGSEPTRQAKELRRIAGEIAKRYSGRVGVVTHKKLAPHFESEFGERNVLHFHALRGTNQLQDVECLIVAGTPSPTISSVVDMATALSRSRVKSFVVVDEQGKARPLWGAKRREFAVSDDLQDKHGGLVPWRAVGGFWAEPDLQAVYDQLRESELCQAIHRARPNVNLSDVWILSSVPTGEPLDGIWDEPPIGPEGIHWQSWLKLQPWLEERLAAGEPITNESIAQGLGVSYSWVREGKWLMKIAEHDNRWRIDTLVPASRKGGRPTLVGLPQGQEVMPVAPHDNSIMKTNRHNLPVLPGQKVSGGAPHDK